MANAGDAVLTGASVANPWIGVAGAFANGLGKGMGSSAPAGPSNAQGRSEAVFDNSGWNISFGEGDITSTSEKTTSTGAGGMGNVNDYMPYFIAAVGAIILWRMSRKKA